MQTVIESLVRAWEEEEKEHNIKQSEMDQRENDAAAEDYLAVPITILILGVSGLLLMAWAWFALYHVILSPFNMAIVTSIIMGGALLAWAATVSYNHRFYQP